jgi:hypothetical protein
VGGQDLVDGPTHVYQNQCSDCHSGRNAFIVHPNGATDLIGRKLVTSSTDWWPLAWPAPIVPAWDPQAAPLGAAWPENPGPQPATGYNGNACFGCHQESGTGGLFPMLTAANPMYFDLVLYPAASRANATCSDATDINCPLGAMPPYLVAPATSIDDPFVTGMFNHTDHTLEQVGKRYAEFRTQLLPPPGGGTLLNGLSTLSTLYNVGYSRNATPFGVSPAGKVVMYDPITMKWITTKPVANQATSGTADQVSVSANQWIWTLKQSGGTSHVCASDVLSCKAGGACNWVCDVSASHSYYQIVAGGGEVVWAIDAGKHTLWATFPSLSGYSPDSFFAMGDWPVADPIAQVTGGFDGDVWVLSANGNISHQHGGGGPDPDAKFSGTWDSIPPPPGGKTVSLSAANHDDVWAASSAGLFRYVPSGNAWEQYCLPGGCTGAGFTTVVAGGDSTGWVADVWALDSAGNVYRVDRTMGLNADSIVPVPGAKLARLSVGGQGDVMGINSSGTVYSFQ